MPDLLMAHDGVAGWYLTERGQRKAQRGAAKLIRITAQLQKLCEEMGWESYTLNFKGGSINPAIYENTGQLLLGGGRSMTTADTNGPPSVWRALLGRGRSPTFDA